MIKRLTMWHAQAEVSADEALRHWRGGHAELVRQVPGLLRYVQDHCVQSPEGTEVPYTGLGEVWFESFEAAAAATATPEWAAVIEDARTFMDFSRVVAAWAEEHVLIDHPTDGDPH